MPFRHRGAALLLVLLAACSDPASDGPLRFSIVEGCVRPQSDSEQVFRSAAAWRDFYRANGGSGPAAEVDFDRFVLAARFDGPGSACVGFTVEGVEVEGDRIVVRATRHASLNPCVAVIAYPQLLVAIEARDLPVVFMIRTVRDEAPGPVRPCI